MPIWKEKHCFYYATLYRSDITMFLTPTRNGRSLYYRYRRHTPYFTLSSSITCLHFLHSLAQAGWEAGAELTTAVVTEPPSAHTLAIRPLHRLAYTMPSSSLIFVIIVSFPLAQITYSLCLGWWASHFCLWYHINGYRGLHYRCLPVINTPRYFAATGFSPRHCRQYRR